MTAVRYGREALRFQLLRPPVGLRGIAPRVIDANYANGELGSKAVLRERQRHLDSKQFRSAPRTG
jgi:hypothetical protein